MSPFPPPVTPHRGDERSRWEASKACLKPEGTSLWCLGLIMHEAGLEGLGDETGPPRKLLPDTSLELTLEAGVLPHLLPRGTLPSPVCSVLSRSDWGKTSSVGLGTPFTCSQRGHP